MEVSRRMESQNVSIIHSIRMEKAESKCHTQNNIHMREEKRIKGHMKFRISQGGDKTGSLRSKRSYFRGKLLNYLYLPSYEL